MIQVADYHLGGPASCSSRLDCSGCPIANSQETHQSAGLSAACQWFILGTQVRKIRACPGSELEQSCLADPQIHDSAVVDQIVLDRLDEASVRLRSFVGAFGSRQTVRLRLNEKMALSRPFDSISPMQARIEPLRRIRSGHLRREHVARFIEKGARILFSRKKLFFPAPVGPCSGQSFKHLLRRPFGSELLLLRQFTQGIRIGNRPANEFGHAGFFHLLKLARHACFAKVFLSKHIDGDLAPRFRSLDNFHLEYGGAVGVSDFGLALRERNSIVRGTISGRENSRYLHVRLLLGFAWLFSFGSAQIRGDSSRSVGQVAAVIRCMGELVTAELLRWHAWRQLRPASKESPRFLSIAQRFNKTAFMEAPEAPLVLRRRPTRCRPQRRAGLPSLYRTAD